MAYKTKAEKRAYRTGLFTGLFKKKNLPKHKANSRIKDTSDQKAWRKNVLVWEFGKPDLRTRKKKVEYGKYGKVSYRNGVRGYYIDGIFEPEWALNSASQAIRRESEKRQKKLEKKYGPAPF